MNKDEREVYERLRRAAELDSAVALTVRTEDLLVMLNAYNWADSEARSLALKLQPKTLDEEREDFEAWVVTRKVCTHKGGTIKKDRAGNYMDYRVNDRWLTWRQRAGV